MRRDLVPPWAGGLSDEEVDVGVFEEMRSLLQQEPSARRWARLCAWAMTAESTQFVDELLPYAIHHLDRSWPDELRVADRA